MDRNNPLSRIAPAATPRMLKRAALFTGGAVMGLTVSAAASYALVSLFSTDSPARLAQSAPARTASVATHTTYMVPLAAVDVAPLPVVLASATVGVADTPVALAPAQLAPQTLAEPAVVSLAPQPATLSPAPAVPAESADAAPVLVTYSAPEITPPARPEPALVADPAALADEIATALPARAQMAPPAKPSTEMLGSADSFAALAADDATARGSATLFASPETTSRIEEVVVASATNLVTSDAIPGLRPKPRPAEPAELMRVASPTPATVAPEAVPASAAQTEVITPRRVSGQTCGSQLTRAMPGRKGNAASGSQFFAGLTNVWGSDRDAQVINELARGNMPDFLRHLVPVTFQGPDARGAQTEITICVTPDYLALGSDRDFVRAPLGLPSAAHIAGLFDMTLPTPRMVDAIYAQADVRLKPQPMQAGPQMSSTAYLLQHNATVQAQLAGRHGLVAGQKKDVVMASRMASHPGRVAIYGWHRSGGNPIQPVSTVHQASYADYSHGIRLVSKTAYLNGKPVSLDDLLASGRYAWLINNDGPMPGPVIRTASR